MILSFYVIYELVVLKYKFNYVTKIDMTLIYNCHMIYIIDSS